MNCPSCGHENPDRAKFCLDCGAAFATRCAHCDTELPATARFCLECGAAVSAAPSPAPEREPRDYTPKHLADKILQSKSALEGEHKQVTVLFADVKGSMELAEQVDPEEWHRILDRFFQILADGVHRFEGTVNQYTGDGIMALFGAPIAHEDHAQRACYAALELRRELRRYANELRIQRSLSFATRIGIHSGDVVVGKIGDDLRMDYTAQGHTVGLAARMQGVAEPGQAYLSEETARRVRGYFELEDLGRVRVKGATDAVGIFALRGLGRIRSRLELSRARGFSKFVGRDDEMEVLEAALERAARGAQERVGIVGEAGVGKSRLCHEFCERARARGLRVTVAECVAHGKKVPLLAWMNALRSYFGISDRDPDDVARDRVTGRMVRLGASFEEDVPFMLDFLGIPDSARPVVHMDADTRMRRLRDLVARLRSARERDEPAIFLWEDLHWIDASSESLLLAEEELDAEPHGTLTVATFRPEYRPIPSSGVAYRQIPLRPLEPASMRELLTDLVGGELAAGPLAHAIQERAAGNPFFVEEIVQTLAESGTLRGTRGAYELTGVVEAIAIPDSVQAVLAARIDRLGEHEKAVLQTASIIGRSFALPLLAGLSGAAEHELETILHRLVEAEFVYEEAIYPEPEYAFRHPLTQEVAYDSQLGERRRRLHGRLVDLLREYHRDRLDENAALLAHHLEQAGRLADAADWHARAAEWVERRDVSEGMRHWRRVIEIEDGLPLPERDGDLHARAYAGALHLCWRMGLSREETRELLERGLAVADRIGSPRLRAKMLIPYAVICGVWGDERERVRWSREALKLARSQGDRALEISARVPLATSLGFCGPLLEALDVIDEGLGASSPQENLGQQDWDFQPYAYLLALRSFVAAQLGEHETAQRDAERAVELVRQDGSSDDLLCSHVYASLSAGLRGDLTRALRHAVESLGAAKKRDSAGTTGMALMAAGVAYLQGGALQDAIEHLENAWPEELPGDGVPGRLSALAQAYLALGDLEKSRDWAERGFSACQAGGHPLDAGRLHLVMAGLLLHPEANGSREEIEAHIEPAEALVRESGARGLLPAVLEARAALARREGDGNQANALLREAHRLYSEMGATGHAQRLAPELGL